MVIINLKDYRSKTNNNLISSGFLTNHGEVNGNNINFRVDYHLSIQELLSKYYPQLTFKNTYCNSYNPKEKAIYVLSFAFILEFAKTSSSKIVNAIPFEIQNQKNVLIILNDAHEYGFYTYHWEDFSNLILELKRVVSNPILVISGNPYNNHCNKKNLLPKISSFSTFLKAVVKPSKVKILTFRYFEEVVAKQLRENYPDFTFSEKLKKLKSHPIKPFLCLNRVNKDFRFVLAFLIFENRLENFFHLSLNKYEAKEVVEIQEGRFKILLNENIIKFNKNLPLSLDTLDFASNHWSSLPMEHIENSVVWVVSETLFDQDTNMEAGFFTEKTYKPMSLFMPFIILGNPFSLLRLQKEGYKTFSQWWNEDYDKEVNPAIRMKKIISLLKELSSYSEDKWIKTITEMQSVLEHNRKILLTNNSGSNTAKYIFEQLKK